MGSRMDEDGENGCPPEIPKEFHPKDPPTQICFIPDTTHGTAIPMPIITLEWFWGVNGAAYMAVPWSVWVYNIK